MQQFDPMVTRATADVFVERASIELSKLLQELASALAPFPYFMDINSIQAVELEPSGANTRAHGCIVVCPDGELYELVLRIIPGPLASGGTEQIGEMRKLELPHGDYVAYAHAAIVKLVTIMEERTS